MSCLSSRISRGVLGVAVTGFILFLPVGTVRAGSVDLSAYGWMASTDDNVDITVLSTSNNGLVVRLQKFADFTDAPQAGVVQPLNVVFRQISRNAVAKLSLDSETVINDSGVTWTGFRFGVSSSVTGAPVTFDTVGSADFSTAPFGTKTFNADQTQLTVSGGSLVSGSFPDNLWQPGRVSGSLVINANPFTSGAIDQSFVFSEQPILDDVMPNPIIPLPASAWLTLGGLGAVAVQLHLRRRASVQFG